VIIVGIDPGTLHLGWGVIRAEGTRLEHVAHGVIHTTQAALCGRLIEIDDALERVLGEHVAQHGAVEALFFAKDAQAASKLGHARGVALLRLMRAGVEVYEYPPARIKLAVAGRGKADKRQVALMVKATLGLGKEPASDAADALAAAITHARIHRIDDALRTGRVPAGPSRPVSRSSVDGYHPGFGK
jgi:crossover junction endodeoxyribonuclease RuvC